MSKRRWFILGLLLSLPAVILVGGGALVGFIAFLASHASSVDSGPAVSSGDPAERAILRLGGRDPVAGRAVADDVVGAVLFDGGNFNGVIAYWYLECRSREGCLRAFEFMSERDRSVLRPWVPSRYAVVMEGPRFYGWDDRLVDADIRERYAHSPWDVRGITDGMVFEEVGVRNNSMSYYAIDFDRNRLYFHRESGGFSTRKYRPAPPKNGPPRP